MKINYDYILKNNPRIHSNNLPPSYYATTANVTTDYPKLTEHIHTDVCIIGGGFSGVNTAVELSEMGVATVILEARKIGWGASGRNGGQVLRGIGQNIEKFRKIIGQSGLDSLYAMGNEAVNIVKQRVKKYDIKCDLKHGSTQVAIKERQFKELEKEAEFLTKMKYPHSITLHNREQIYDVVRSKKYIGGLTLGGDAHVHPLNLCLGEAQITQQLGTQLFEYSPVVELDIPDQTTNKKKITIKTTHGRITATKLVIACNAYLSNLHKSLQNIIMPAGSYIIATEPLADSLEILPQDTAVSDLNYALDYYRLSADNRLLFGGLCNYSAQDPASISKTLIPKMLSVFPQLANVKIEYEWGGMIGIGINRMPQIGYMAANNVYYAQAYAGHGLNATHMASRLIAESITERSNRIELFNKIKHHRFPGMNNKVKSTLFAIGMAYFRFIDLF